MGHLAPHRLARALPLLVAFAVVLPAIPAGGQWDPLAPIVETARPIVDEATARVVGQLENETGQDLHREDIAVELVLDVRNVDDDVVGILFGGGKVGAEAVAVLRLDFRAVSMERLDEALRASTGDANMSAARLGVPTSRLALTAEEIRLVGAGEMLAAFQTAQVAAAKDYLQRTIPGLTVLDLTASWTNTLPVSDLRDQEPNAPNATDPNGLLTRPPIPPLREPPLVLTATAHLQYVDRVSLLSILQSAGDAEDDSDRLQDRIERNQTDAPLDRSAFRLLGLNQLLDFQVPPGWRLNVTITVPQGYTIEGATDELTLADDHRSVTYRVNGDDRSAPMQQAAVVGLSNRFVVTATLLAGVLLVGYILRMPSEMAAVRVTYGRWRRAGFDAARPPFAARLRQRLGWPARRRT